MGQNQSQEIESNYQNQSQNLKYSDNFKQQNNGQSPSTGLSSFCCNSSLCNNDSNIDNRMTEVNRRKQDRNNNILAAGMHRPDQNPPLNVFGGQQYQSKGADYQTGATNSSKLGMNQYQQMGYGSLMGNTTNNNNYSSTGGALLSQQQFTRDEFGNTVHVPMNNDGVITARANNFNNGQINNQLFQDDRVRDQVMNALSLNANINQQFQHLEHLQSSAGGNEGANRFTGGGGQGGTGQGDLTAGTSKSQMMSPQQEIQNEILSSPQSMLEYKLRVLDYMKMFQYQQLNLEVVSSATLQKGDIITVNPIGLFGNYQSLRQIAEQEQNLNDSIGQGIVTAPDSFTYFGSIPDISEADQDGVELLQSQDYQNSQSVVVNDFVIPPRNRDSAEQHKGRHFQIWFDIGISQQQMQMIQNSYQNKKSQLLNNLNSGYYIKDLGIGFGVFKKMDVQSNKNILQQAGIIGQNGVESGSLTQKLPNFSTGCIILKDNMLINIGEAYIVVNLLPEGVDDDGTHHTLKLKIFGGSNNGEVYEFNVKDMDQGQREIILGRTPDCDIKINDKLLSKTQCHIKLWFENEDNYKWMLLDGCKGKPSTNGTWLYINEDMKIYDAMVFKANQTIFSVSMTNFQAF